MVLSYAFLFCHAAPACEDGSLFTDPPPGLGEPRLLSRMLHKLWKLPHNAIENADITHSEDVQNVVDEANAKASQAAVAGYENSDATDIDDETSRATAVAAPDADLAAARDFLNTGASNADDDHAFAAAEKRLKSLPFTSAAAGTAGGAASAQPAASMLAESVVGARSHLSGMPLAVRVADSNRQEAVKEAFRHAMLGYANYAW